MTNAISRVEGNSIVKESTFAVLKTFLIVWLGQSVSILGSSMTGFALGVWVFQQTGSAASFALTLLFNMLPKALISPFAGLLADRHDRRWIMILTDLGAGIATVIVVLLYASGRLSIWHIYLLTALNAGASAFQGPAFSAALTQLVPKEHLGRANGLQQMGEGVGQVIAPILAGTLIVSLGLGSVLIFDLLTFLFAVSILLMVRFPDFLRPERGGFESSKTWRSQIGQALNYLNARPGLLGLILVFSLVNFFVGVAEAVLTPMVLSFTTPENLGAVMTFGGLGMLLGSLLLTVFGGGRRKVNTVFGAYAVLGLAVCSAGLRPSTLLVGVSAFLAFLCLPSVMGLSQAILQAKVVPHIQGRIFGLRMFLNTLTFTLAYLIGGLLADSFFEPLMAVNGPLAGSVGRLIGVGPGRGMGLMFILMGVLAVFSALSAFAYPRIRRVESEIPDVV